MSITQDDPFYEDGPKRLLTDAEVEAFERWLQEWNQPDPDLEDTNNNNG